MRQAFIDLDGVLADFNTYYTECFGEKPTRALGQPDPPDLWPNITRHGRFYANLPLMPDALDLWHGVKALHPTPIILTAVPYSVPEAEDQKRDWVREHIDPQAVVICCRAKEKRLHGKPGDVLVDDWLKYRGLWEAMGGIFILHRSADESLAALREVMTARSF